MKEFNLIPASTGRKIYVSLPIEGDGVLGDFLENYGLKDAADAVRGSSRILLEELRHSLSLSSGRDFQFVIVDDPGLHSQIMQLTYELGFCNISSSDFFLFPLWWESFRGFKGIQIDVSALTDISELQWILHFLEKATMPVLIVSPSKEKNRLRSLNAWERSSLCLDMTSEVG